MLPDVHPRASPAEARRGLKEAGWTEGLELAKLVRSEGQRLDCAIGLHKAQPLPKEEFKREVEKELTGRENHALGDYLFCDLKAVGMIV